MIISNKILKHTTHKSTKPKFLTYCTTDNTNYDSTDIFTKIALFEKARLKLTKQIQKRWCKICNEQI